MVETMQPSAPRLEDVEAALNGFDEQLEKGIIEYKLSKYCVPPEYSSRTPNCHFTPFIAAEHLRREGIEAFVVVSNPGSFDHLSLNYDHRLTVANLEPGLAIVDTSYSTLLDKFGLNYRVSQGEGRDLFPAEKTIVFAEEEANSVAEWAADIGLFFRSRIATETHAMYPHIFKYPELRNASRQELVEAFQPVWDLTNYRRTEEDLAVGAAVELVLDGKTSFSKRVARFFAQQYHD